MRVYNTLTRAKEEFTPLTPGEVRMYVCGVTVYDDSHIGHARSAVVFDVIRRYLRHRGYRVTFVKNYTDVDDRIIRRATEAGVPTREISERYIDAYQRDMQALSVLAADVEPKATEHIPEMIALIERLVADGFAYVVEGDVYFEIRRFPPYGRLSGKNLDELLAGARVEVDERKRDPRDFALWKAAKPGEPSWPSPWGSGRPGWHIECSAMAMRYLGESFDIHGGGEDLIFPHHECEVAQAEAATKKPFARYWIHNGFVNMGAEKMSKSLGNTLTIREIVKRHDPDALRLWMLGTHYRHPIEWSAERIQESARALERLRELVVEYQGTLESSGVAPQNDPLSDEIAARAAQFQAAMDDDFNTPQALAALFEVSHILELHRDLMFKEGRDPAPFIEAVRTLRRLAGALGLLERAGKQLEGWGFVPRWIEAPSSPRTRAYQFYGWSTSDAPMLWWADTQRKIDALIRERDEARRRRDWKRADVLRGELGALGATVEDTPAGTRWKWKGV